MRRKKESSTGYRAVLGGPHKGAVVVFRGDGARAMYLQGTDCALLQGQGPSRHGGRLDSSGGRLCRSSVGRRDAMVSGGGGGGGWPFQRSKSRTAPEDRGP